MLGLVGTAALLGVVEFLVVLDGPLRPRWVSTLIPLIAAAYLGGGVVAWLRRPSSHVGALLALAGVFWLVSGFSDAAVPALVSLGAVTATLPLAVVVHLLVAFPSGRLHGLRARVLVGAGYVTCVVLQAPLYLFADHPAPYDGLQVADRADLQTVGIWVQRGAGITVMVLTAALLVGRLRDATPPQRHVLVPLYAYGIGAVLATPLGPTVLAPWLHWTPVTTFVIQIAVLTLIPVAFGWSLLRGGFARTAEVEELGAWLGAEQRERATLRQALADTLGDPSLGLLFWVPDRGGYVDVTGRPALPPVAEPLRGTAEVRLGDRRVGAITYDLEAVGDRELVHTAGRMVAIALDHERLTAELLANELALRRSRQRLVEAGDRGRRQVERNLHDGAQQRILAVIMSLRMIEAGAAADDATVLRKSVAEAADDLEDAMHELRELARGLHPALLTEIGLAAALESLAERSPIPVQLTVRLTSDLPESTGVGAYYVVSEALTNAARHSEAAEVEVSASTVDGMLRVAVIDDGIGGASPLTGSGLEGLLDRVDSLGGRLRIHSESGTGTSIVAELPCG